MATKGSAKKGRRARTPPAAKTRAGLATHTPEEFPATRYVFFGGKGGVGKTTAAASAALALLDSARAGESILLFSTDPAHSLSDSLGVRVGDRTAEVARGGRGAGAPRLFAREMDAARALEEFKTKHRAVLAEIADRGTILDEADINDLLDLSLPGMDEVMALFELSEVERAGVYSRVVVDTAPSGHTSRMLRLPAVFSRWVGALDVMSEKHRYMVSHFVRGRAARADEVDLFLRDLSERVGAVRSMLFDPARASFVLVTIPEAMAFEESARYFKSLREEGVPVTDMVVNRVEREHGGCPLCRARAAMQSPWLDALAREFESLRRHHVPLFPGEVRGPRALREFARAAWQAHSGSPAVMEGVSSRAGRIDEDKRPPSRPGFRLGPKRLVIFGGKGGVGKTTAAAAYALALAESSPEARVLLFSTDPAHSLSDGFGERVGEMKRGVAGVANLDAKEVDPAARFEELKERYRRWTDELFDSLGGGSRFEVKFDREAMRE
ncbi:MAG TPA: TRC40/GET3/ArsA family transport-energizing ATPase, partial [Pyrinomonadaceae bacterium]|nr:TRC40/GET3/ArsA family transport-energizing ATPase [Pyrinomonadaceae bacterium]